VGSTASSQARLLAEAQTMARLSPPNIVAVHEVGTYEGRVYIAMESIEGDG
jgi:serine/threonine protein kinase